MNTYNTTSVTDPDMMKLAEKRVKAKTEFMWHLASYVLVNTFLVFLYIISSGWYFWPIWPILGWGLGLAFHAVSFLFTLSSVNHTDKVMYEYNRLKHAESGGSLPHMKDIDDRRN